MVKSIVSLLLFFMVNQSMASTDAIWEHHIKAWEERDLEAIVSDYTDQSVLILNNRVFTGKNEIRKVFIRLFKIFDNGVNEIQTPVVIDRLVYITWLFSPNGSHIKYFGTDTFIIEKGKIIYQTIASPLYN